MPQVSIIIPTYNGDRFIAAALDSLLSQTYQNYEIIVVDDGSTDQTVRVLETFGDRLRYIEQQHCGVAVARNRGLELAQGEFIAFFDQDDLMLPNKLALQVGCFEQHPVDIVHSGWRLIDAQEQTLADIEPWHEVPVLDAASWILRMPVLFSAMLFRRDRLHQLNGLPTQYQQACDVALIQQLVLLGCQTLWIREVTTLYRQHDQNDSLNTIVQAQECWTVQEQFFARSDIPLQVRQIERESRYYTLVWIAWRLYHTGHLQEMAIYLERAFGYRPGTWTEAILQWIEFFKQYETQYGQELNADQLTRSSEWQQLLQRLHQMALKQSY